MNTINKDYKVPEYLKWMNEEEKLENQKIIKNMNKRIEYKRNPRYLVDKEAIRYKSLIHNQQELKENEQLVECNSKNVIFRCNPKEVIFTNYIINNYYQQELIVTNATNISQRLKVLHPSSEQFSIDSINYPMNNTLIAPGMSVIIVINFKATSMSEFQDQIGIIAESNSFFVQLKSKKQPPQIQLPSILNCGSCWFGDKLSTVFKIKNTGGGAGYKLFKFNNTVQNYNSQTNINDNFLQLNNFSIYPSEFYIEKNETQVIQVEFNPLMEGNISEKIIMAADDETNCVYTLTGTANIAEFKIESVDDKELMKEQSDLFYNQQNVIKNFRKLEFLCKPNEMKTRVVRIKNMSGVRVKYKWLSFAIRKDDIDYLENQLANSLTNNQDHNRFSVIPSEGFFEGLSTQQFLITYDANTNHKYFQLDYIQFFNLVVMDIPIKSIQNPSRGLQQQNNLNHINNEEDNIITNTKTPEISVYEFEFIGKIYTSQVQCQPSFIIQNQILIQQVQKIQFKLINQNNVASKYNIQELVFQQQDQLEIIQISNQSGVIQENETKEIEVYFKCNQVSKQLKSELEIVLENQSNQYFSILVETRDSKVTFDQPFIDFDLIQSTKSKTITVSLTNHDEKETVCFFTSNDIDQSIGDQVLQLITKQGLTQVPPIKLGNNLLIFNQQIVWLPAKSTQQIQISYSADLPETLKDYIKLFINNQPFISIFVFAEVQNMHVTLNRFNLNFDCLYAGNNYKINRFNDQKVEIQNYGNIDTNFKWKNEQNEDFIIQYNPKEGTIKAKENLVIEIEITVFKGGKFEYIMICEVDGIEFSLGVQIETQVKGLQVDYLALTDEFNNSLGKVKQDKSKQKIQGDYMSQTKSKKSKVSKRTQNKLDQTIDMSKELEYPQLQNISFNNCQINKPQQIKIELNNTSGIDSSFRIDFEEYQVLDNLIEKIQKKNQTEEDEVNKYILKKEKALRFTSQNGRELDYQRKLQNDSKYYLQMNKGVALVCEPHQGELKGNSQQQITITCFNDICGAFNDKMKIHVKGLPSITFDVQAIITGSPIKIPKNQLGLEFGNNLYPKIKFGVSIKNQNRKEKLIRVENSGPKEVNIQWKILLVNQQSKGPFFKFQILPNTQKTNNYNGKYKVKWQAIEPQQNDNEKCFGIEPQVKTMKGRSEYQFRFWYSTSNSIGSFHAVAIAQSSIQNTNQQLEDLIVKLQAETKQPQLLLEKLNLQEKQEATPFQLINLYKKIDKEADNKVIKLYNQIGCDLQFNIKLQGPFNIINKNQNLDKYQKLSYQNQIQDQLFSLTDKSNLELSLKYNPSQNDIQESTLVTKYYSQGYLEILFTNGDKQCIKLEGQLLRPSIQLFTQGFQNYPEQLLKNEKQITTVDFKIIYIKNKKTLSLFVSNLTCVDANVKIAHVKRKPNNINQNLATITKLEQEEFTTTDDPQVFEFNLSEFVLKGPSIQVNKMPESQALPQQLTINDIQQRELLPQQLKVNFRPKKDIQYKSKFRLILKDGISIDFYLKGQGTYQEEMENKY